ncbi:MAG TPA: GNAT family protein [Gaiellaceae bacterium]|nr:GNAT family protein [Gaiellaceae bacterium]
MTVAIRRARGDDLDFLAALVTDDEVQPFLAAGRPNDRDIIGDDIRRSQEEPETFGVFVIEVDGARAGVMRFSSRGGPNRIAELGGLAVHPEFRGRKVADEAARLFQRHLFEDLGFHRLQLEVYGFNDRAMGHAERSGFVLEGRKRRAYLHDGEWVDGVIYGLTTEDLEGEPSRGSPSAAPDPS